MKGDGSEKRIKEEKKEGKKKKPQQSRDCLSPGNNSRFLLHLVNTNSEKLPLTNRRITIVIWHNFSARNNNSCTSFCSH